MTHYNLTKNKSKNKCRQRKKVLETCNKNKIIESQKHLHLHLYCLRVFFPVLILFLVLFWFLISSFDLHLLWYGFSFIILRLSWFWGVDSDHGIRFGNLNISLCQILSMFIYSEYQNILILSPLLFKQYKYHVSFNKICTCNHSHEEDC